jgi:hypothetical protein
MAMIAIGSRAPPEKGRDRKADRRGMATGPDRLVCERRAATGPAGFARTTAA